MKLPDSLNRKAIMEIFNHLEPVTWEKLFEREDSNGIGRLRTSGDYRGKAYYQTHGIMDWLVRNGHYTLDDFSRSPRFGGESRMHEMSARPLALGVRG